MSCFGVALALDGSRQSVVTYGTGKPSVPRAAQTGRVGVRQGGSSCPSHPSCPEPSGLQLRHIFSHSRSVAILHTDCLPWRVSPTRMFPKTQV
jgi:hypothetical protein